MMWPNFDILRNGSVPLLHPSDDKAWKWEKNNTQRYIRRNSTLIWDSMITYLLILQLPANTFGFKINNFCPIWSLKLHQANIHYFTKLTIKHRFTRNMYHNLCFSNELRCQCFSQLIHPWIKIKNNSLMSCHWSDSDSLKVFLNISQCVDYPCNEKQMIMIPY